MRQEANTDMMKQYVDTLNERFLRPETHYDPATKKYNIGAFYIHQGMGRRGVDYEIREIESEEGGYRTVSPQGITSEQCLFWLDGLMFGHYNTCELLGYELKPNTKGVLENTTDEHDIEQAIENEDVEGDLEIALDEEGIGEIKTDAPEEASADEEGKIEG